MWPKAPRVCTTYPAQRRPPHPALGRAHHRECPPAIGSPRHSSLEFTPLQRTRRHSTRLPRDEFQTPRGNSLLCNLMGHLAARSSWWCVSNPSREFTPLQLCAQRAGAARWIMFQTPRGNSLLCNPNPVAYSHKVADKVSNPSREFTPLQPNRLRDGFYPRWHVSNPSREFTPLQLGRKFNLADAYGVSFKPLAGIHSSATRPLVSLLIWP